MTIEALNENHASYYAQVGDDVIANNLTLPWNEVVVSPSEYQLEVD